MIRPVARDDAEAICRIYNHYVMNTIVTFDEEPVRAAPMAERIETVTAAYPWLVWEDASGPIGYACANRWRPHAAYRTTAESSIYVDPAHLGQGIGGRLYRQLLDELSRQPVHAVLGVLALPNDASVALHEKLGFEKTAQFREVGRKFDQWIDVGYWQLLLP